MQKRVGNIVLGLSLMGVAFWVGSQKSPVFGLIGFLCFFVLAIHFIFSKPRSG